MLLKCFESSSTPPMPSTAGKPFSQTKPALHCHSWPTHCHDAMPPQFGHQIRTMSSKGTSSITPLREPTWKVQRPCLCFPLNYNSKLVSMRRTCFKQEARFWAGWGLLDTCGTQFENPCSARNVLYLLWHHSSEFQEKNKTKKTVNQTPWALTQIWSLEAHGKLAYW